MSRGRSRDRVARACAAVPATLFLARVALEATRRPLPGPLVLSVGALAVLAGLALGRWVLRDQHWHWSLWLPLVYVVWPQRDLVVAVAVAAATVLTYLLARAGDGLPDWADRASDGALFAAGLVVYVATAAPDVLPADSGEFQLAAAQLGVVHPPGFPLYTMAGHLFIRMLPVGSPAYRLNLFSALMAAASLVLVAAATRIWARRLGATRPLALASGLAAAVTLGTATTFWAQARVANIRMPSTLSVTLILYALARLADAADRRSADRALLLLGVALGLGLGHHPSLAFAAIFYVGYAFLSEASLVAEPRRWWRLAVAVPVAVLPYIYLPVRGAMGAPLAPAGLSSVQGFLNHVLARGFAGDMFAYANLADLPHRVSLIPTLFRFQFNAVLFAAALVSLVMLFRRDRKLFALLAGSLIAHTFVTITYRAPQTVEYLMPAVYPVVGVAVGLCPTLVSERYGAARQRPAGAVGALFAAAVLVAGGLNGWAHGPSYAELADDRTARETVRPLLDQAPADALVLSDWHWVTPMWYLQQLEGVRPDVEVRYVYNVPGEHYRQTWRRRVEQAPPGRDLLLTHFYDYDGYTTEPWAAGFTIRERPVTDLAAPITPVDIEFGGLIRVVGYSLRPGQPRVGQPVEVTLAWEPVRELDMAPSLSVRLAGAGGDRLAQADRTLATGVGVGEIRFERVTLPAYPFLAAGDYRLTLGAYVAGGAGYQDLEAADGQTVASLTGLALKARTERTYVPHLHEAPFGNGAALVGVAYDRSVPGTLRTYLLLRGPVGEGIRATLVGPGEAQASAVVPPVPAGAYQMVVLDLEETYQAGGARLRLTGPDRLLHAAGIWGWATEGVSLPRPAPDAVYIPLGEDVGVTGSSARPARPGDEMVIEAFLAGLRPLTSDYAISIRLIDEEDRWLARQDWQPALGAIPTLKWIRGSQVVDRHLLSVPEDYEGERVRAELVAYERFREAPLPPMDGRFGAAPLGSWDQPGRSGTR